VSNKAKKVEFPIQSVRLGDECLSVRVPARWPSSLKDYQGLYYGHNNTVQLKKEDNIPWMLRVLFHECGHAIWAKFVVPALLLAMASGKYRLNANDLEVLTKILNRVGDIEEAIVESYTTGLLTLMDSNKPFIRLLLEENNTTKPKKKKKK